MKMKFLVFFFLVLPIFPLVKTNSGNSLDGGYFPIAITGSVPFNFESGRWNLFSIPFSGYTAYSFGSLCDAISVVSVDLLTGSFTSFILGVDTPGSARDFQIEPAYSYYIWVNSDVTVSVSGSVDYFYYPGYDFYQIQAHYPLSIGGNVFVGLSYPSFISTTLGQLFNSMSLTPNVRVLTVSFMNSFGEFDEFNFASVTNYAVGAGDAFFVKFSGSTTWDPYYNQYSIPIPAIQIISPTNGYSTYNSKINVYTTDCNGFASYMKFYRGSTYIGTDYTTDSSYRFSYYVSLLMGSNTITAKAFTVDGTQISSTSITVYRLDKYSPPPPIER